MNRKIIYIIALITCFALPANAQFSKVLEEISNLKGVTSVNISETMLELIGGSAAQYIDADNINVAAIMPKLKSISILNTEDAKSMKLMSLKLNEYIAQSKLQPLMTTKEDDEITRIYFNEAKKKGEYSNFILWVEEIDEISFICLSGTFTVQDLKAIMNQ